MGKIDLTDAYLHVPVNKEFQRYLAFPWKDRIFAFTCLPFGLCLAPAVFQGLINFPLRLFKAKGILCLAYLDDIIIFASSEQKCREDLLFAQDTLVRLGFILNLEKSQLVPTQSIVWLGAVWDSRSLSLQLPQEKAQVISSMASSLLEKGKTSRKQWESLLGHLAFAAQISQELNLHKKLLGPILPLIPEDVSSLSLPRATLSALAWWTNLSNFLKPFPFKVSPPSVLLWTDACQTGWGGHDQSGSWVAGSWGPNLVGSHMNILELQAVFLSLQSSLVPVGSSVSLFRQFNDCPSSPEAGLLSIPVSYISSEQHLLPVSKERIIDLSSQNPRESQRTGRCSISKCPSPGRMGAPSSRSTGYPRSVPKLRSGPDGNPLQLCSGILRKPFQSPLGNRGGCLESGLESMEGGLPVSSPLASDQGLPSPALVQRQDGPDFKSSSSTVPPHGSSEVNRSSLPAPPSPQTACSGSLDRGWKALVLSLDGTSLLRSHLTEKYGFSMADRLVNGKRQSTLYQQNIAWKAFQEFLSSLEDSDCPVLLGLENSPLSISHVLHFCVWLREYKNLQSTTIANYKSSVGGILQSVFNLDCSTWEFSALRNNFFLEKPTNPPRVPEWDIQKVLLMLDSGDYINSPPSKFLQLKKTLFLLAIATGNRVSELHAITRNGLGTPDPDQPVRLAVKPGFLYKNQKANRAPPNIEVVPLTEGPPSLCPVKNLALYLKLTSKVATGPLFLNSKTDAPIHKSTVSRLICAVIDEADPGKFPRVHDTRRVGTSIAWSRGLDPQEIIRRTFWRSSSIFIDRYLSVKGGINCVALNTC